MHDARLLFTIQLINCLTQRVQSSLAKMWIVYLFLFFCYFKKSFWVIVRNSNHFTIRAWFLLLWQNKRMEKNTRQKVSFRHQNDLIWKMNGLCCPTWTGKCLFLLFTEDKITTLCHRNKGERAISFHKCNCNTLFALTMNTVLGETWNSGSLAACVFLCTENTLIMLWRNPKMCVSFSQLYEIAQW